MTKKRNPLNLTEQLSTVAERMAALTPGFAGAEIAHLQWGASLLRVITNLLLAYLLSEKAADRVIRHREAEQIMTPLESGQAYHEAGHAIVDGFRNTSPLLKVTIVHVQVVHLDSLIPT